VAGAAALFKAEHPDATPQEIMNMTLSSSSKPEPFKHDLRKALEEALELWIDRTERAHQKTPGKTKISWS
jgi:hypothetical protein